MTPSRTIIVCLGRFGDVASILPMAFGMSQRGEKPIFCVAQDFASILSGVSYVDPLIYPGRYDDPPAALRWLKANRPKDRVIIAQSYRHPSDKQHLTKSYQTESWRLAGKLDEFATHPLVFDQRNQAREEKFCDRILAGKKPAILVATSSISSPFATGPQLFQTIEASFPDHSVIDLSAIHAEAIYDLIALYDRAVCLVSVDTLHAHLCRAAKCPVVLIKNDGWLGSVVPPSAVEEIDYDSFKNPDIGTARVLVGIQRIIKAKGRHRFVVHCCDTHGDTERHVRARDTWMAGYGDEDVLECLHRTWPRTSMDVADGRKLPALHDIFNRALELAHDDGDVILWSNSDNGFQPGASTVFKEHAALYGAFSMRRSRDHIGRDAFGFQAGWLRSHLHLIPEFWCGAPAFDLVLAAIIRRDRGIKTTKGNIMVDFFPCELEPGLVTHEPHESSWAGENENTWPANLVNLSLARRWAADLAIAPIV